MPNLGTPATDSTTASGIELTYKAGKLGKLPAAPRPMKTLLDYMKGSLPKAPTSLDYGPRVTGGFPMALNDQYGDCTIAGADHLLQLAYATIGENFVYPGDDVIQSTYFGLTGGQDTGLAEQNVLNTWKDSGLLGTQIHSWVAIEPKNQVEMQLACYLFGGVYLGLDIPQAAENQFNNQQPWHLTIPRGNPIGGHCVVASGYNRNGINLITWGKETAMTWDFWEYYGDEAYCVIPQAFIEAGHGPVASIDILQLEADQRQI